MTKFQLGLILVVVITAAALTVWATTAFGVLGTLATPALLIAALVLRKAFQ